MFLRNLILTLVFYILNGSFLFAYDKDRFNKAINEFKPYLNNCIKDWKVPGGAIAIVNSDRTYFFKFGRRHMNRIDKIDEDTLFRIASLSKGFSSTLVGILVEENLLQWDSPLDSFSHDYIDSLSLRQLMNQSTGYPPYTLDDYIESNLSFKKTLTKINSIEPKYTPGKIHTYQNTIFSLVEPHIDSTLDQNFSDYLKSHIVDPLNMKNTSWGPHIFINASNRATPHNEKDLKYTPASLKSNYYEVLPAAGINSSIKDMSIWLRAQLGLFPGVISPRVLDEIHRPHIETPEKLNKKNFFRKRLKQAHYALGWRVYDYSGNKLVYHAGFLSGFCHAIGFLPNEKVGIVLLFNSDTSLANILLAKFMDLYLNLPSEDWSKQVLTTKRSKK